MIPLGNKTFSKNRIWSRTSFIPLLKKDNVKVIDFHLKRRGAQGLVFVLIRFEKCTTNFIFENDEFGKN